jgi:hypothetical protein
MSELIILDADDGLHFLPSRAAAESWMEAIDVEDGIYTVYNADGARLDLTVSPVGDVVISSPQTQQDCRAQLAPRMTDFFMRFGVPDDVLSGLAFSDLVQLGAERFIEPEPQPIGALFWAMLRHLFGPRRAT